MWTVEVAAEREKEEAAESLRQFKGPQLLQWSRGGKKLFSMPVTCLVQVS